MVFGLEFLTQFVQTFGYLGFVVVGFLSSFTIFLPSPAFIVVFVSAPFFNPVLLGIATGLGAAIGEMTSYALGYGLETIAEKKSKKKSRFRKQIEEVKKWFKKYHPDFVIFFFAAMPLLPVDAVGIFCGAIKYDKRKFFFFMLIGKIIKFTVLAFMGFYGIGFALDYFGLDLT